MKKTKRIYLKYMRVKISRIVHTTLYCHYYRPKQCIAYYVYLLFCLTAVCMIFTLELLHFPPLL